MILYVNYIHVLTRSQRKEPMSFFSTIRLLQCSLPVFLARQSTATRHLLRMLLSTIVVCPTPFILLLPLS